MKPATRAGSKFLSIPEPDAATMVWSIVAIQAGSHFSKALQNRTTLNLLAKTGWMQISRLFDKYRIHENFSGTQPHSTVMLVKTLTKLFEHIVQHLFAPLQAKPLRILFL